MENRFPVTIVETAPNGEPESAIVILDQTRIEWDFSPYLQKGDWAVEYCPNLRRYATRLSATAWEQDEIPWEFIISNPALVCERLRVWSESPCIFGRPRWVEFIQNGDYFSAPHNGKADAERCQPCMWGTLYWDDDGNLCDLKAQKSPE